MAVEGEEAEYESDPEDLMLPSALRRREASDDEDGEGSDGGGKPVKKDRAGIGSDGESDGQGGAPGYEDDEEYEEEEEEMEEVEEVEQAEVGDGDGGASGVVESPELVGPESGEDGGRSGGNQAEFQGKNQGEEEEKKENEPYAVPTAGAFYMHDDRFQENGRGRHRRMPGVRKLWESRDDRAWVHDRFEEMNLQDTHYDEERRNSKGHFRGRGGGKNRGAVRGYVRGNRSRAYYDDSNNQNRAPKSVRGRGPRRYEPLPKNSEIPASQHRRSAKPQELTSNSSTGRQSSQSSNVKPDPVLPRKHVFASSLNSASPPFYPSVSSNQDVTVTQKRVAQTGSTNKTVSSSMQMENNFPASQSGSLLRGKAIVDSTGHDGLHIDDSLRSVAGRTLSNAQLQSSGSSLQLANTTQSPHSRVQGRSLSIPGTPNYQPNLSLSQTARVSAQIQTPVVQQRPVQAQLQPALRISTQQSGQRPVSGNQVSSPPQATFTDSTEVGETDSPPGSSKSKTALVGKGKTGNQGAGRSSFLYSGAQVIGATGAVGLAHGDQNFPGTRALLPVMQFGGQHPGGLGVPAVGMALPGYVAQPQLGFGNSEMTWVPVLAGAAGALGASYCPPYIALDGSYYARPSGQTSASVTSSKETSAAKASNMLNPPQRPEIVNDEFGQRQNKPRRYSEMNFGQ